MATVVDAVDAVFKTKKNGSLIVVGCASSFEYTVTREVNEATCSRSPWASKSAGKMSWSGSLSAVYHTFLAEEEGSELSYEDFIAILTEGKEVDVEFSYVEGGKRHGGKMLVSEVSISRPESGPVTWSVNFEGNGEFKVLTGTPAV